MWGITLKAAQEMGRRRMLKLSAEERSEHAKMMSEKRQEKTTPEQRSAAAKKTAAARWKSKKETPRPSRLTKEAKPKRPAT